jgi:hypothetical protein
MSFNPITKIAFAKQQCGIALQFLMRDLPECALRGGVTVETLCQHVVGSPAQVSEVRLRTIMQLDGDVINFLPDPHLFPDDADWRKVYTEGQSRHQEKIQRLLMGFDGIHHLIRVTINIITVTIVVGSVLGAIQKHNPYKAVTVVCLFPLITYTAVYAAKTLVRMIIQFLLRKNALTEFLGHN